MPRWIRGLAACGGRATTLDGESALDPDPRSADAEAFESLDDRALVEACSAVTRRRLTSPSPGIGGLSIKSAIDSRATTKMPATFPRKPLSALGVD